MRSLWLEYTHFLVFYLQRAPPKGTKTNKQSIAKICSKHQREKQVEIWIEELKQINEETRNSFNLAAEKYFELFKDEMKHKEYDRALLDKFAGNFDSKSIICDVGCGPGHITRYLFDKGLNVFGIDISERCIQIARRENPEMRFQVMDMARSDIADESIDGIISFYSIIHTPKRLIHFLSHEFKSA